MICDTLGYKDGDPFMLVFGFLVFHYALPVRRSCMLFFSQEQSHLNNEWWDNMQLLKESTAQTIYKSCINVVHTSYFPLPT